MHNFLQQYKDAGFSFFNTLCAQKKVLMKWTTYMDRYPTEKEISDWLTLPTQNYALVTGRISNLIVIDVDTKNGGDPAPFQNRNLYEVRTPSGGYHFYVRYDSLLESTKHKKKKTDGILYGVDLQSNGALAFAPPSAFSNGKYEIINDAQIIPIPDDLLTSILEALEPEKTSTVFTPYIPPTNAMMGRPGDIFNTLASWDDILIPLGWDKVGHKQESGIQYWRRPGKKDGISASTDYKGYGLFFCFSTSVGEIEQMRGYTKFSLLAHLRYGGDFRETAKALVVDNYKRVIQSVSHETKA